jgi:glycosyltransferase involved in cell wall biosynthesis
MGTATLTRPLVAHPRHTIVQLVADGRPGGGTTAVLTLSRLLAARGCDVVVIGQQHSYLLKEASQAGLRTRGMDFSSRRNTLHAAMKLRGHFYELSPSVIHAHGARAGLPAVIAAGRRDSKARRGRLVYTVHGFHYLAKPPLMYALARAAEALCIARADCTNFVSDGDCAIAQSHGLLRRSRAHATIKNAVLVDGALASAPKLCDIGFLGRLTGQKNPLILVDVLKAMRPLKPTLSIIGGGPLAAELRARVMEAGLSGQIVMHGERGRAEALRIASSCRVLLLPSRWEGHPIALIEAMHLGLPAVASDVPGSNEIVVHGETGYLVPAQDVEGYAACLARLLGDAQTMDRMKRDARRRALEYSPERMVSAHMRLYGLNGAVHAEPVPQ